MVTMKIKQKICFIDPKFLKSIGGVETHGYEFVRYFSKDSRYKIEYIFSKAKVSDGINHDSKNKELEKKVIRKLTGDLKKDAALILKMTPDINIYFFNNPNWLPIAKDIRKVRPNAKIFVRSGGNDIPAGWVVDENDKSVSLLKNRKILVNTINKSVDSLIVNSDFSRERMIALGIKPSKITKVIGGVDCSSFVPNKNPESKKIEIAFWGRLVEFKGINYSLKAINEVRKKHKDITFTIIGDGPEREKMMKMIPKLNMKSFVKYKGLVEFYEIPPLVKDAKIFLHLPIYLEKKVRGSKYIHTETMGRTYCEATSLGMVSVISNVGGGPEIIREGENGFVVPEKDYKLAAQKISELIENPQLLERMGRKGRKIARKEFDWKILINKYKELFK